MPGPADAQQRACRNKRAAQSQRLWRDLQVERIRPASDRQGAERQSGCRVDNRDRVAAGQHEQLVRGCIEGNGVVCAAEIGLQERRNTKRRGRRVIVDNCAIRAGCQNVRVDGVGQRDAEGLIAFERRIAIGRDCKRLGVFARVERDGPAWEDAPGEVRSFGSARSADTGNSKVNAGCSCGAANPCQREGVIGCARIAFGHIGHIGDDGNRRRGNHANDLVLIGKAQNLNVLHGVGAFVATRGDVIDNRRDCANRCNGIIRPIARKDHHIGAIAAVKIVVLGAGRYLIVAGRTDDVFDTADRVSRCKSAADGLRGQIDRHASCRGCIRRRVDAAVAANVI